MTVSRTQILTIATLGILLAVQVAHTGDQESPIIDDKVLTLEGEPFDFAELRGKAILIVNTASECGYTRQYEGLQKLYSTFEDRGLVVVGFPSNDFGAQEPGKAAEIRRFCTDNFKVTFPMMAKVHTKGPDLMPIYRTLTERTPEGIRGEVRWNFTKFLVDPTGRVVARFEPKVEPMSDEVITAVERDASGAVFRSPRSATGVLRCFLRRRETVWYG